MSLVNFYQGNKNTHKKIKTMAPNAVAISAITVAELRYGIAKIKGTKKSKEIDNFTKELFKTIKIIPLDAQIASAVGEIKAELETNGDVTGSYDLLIAATAIDKGLILVTSNIKDFQKIEGLKIQNWREE